MDGVNVRSAVRRPRFSVGVISRQLFVPKRAADESDRNQSDTLPAMQRTPKIVTRFLKKWRSAWNKSQPPPSIESGSLGEVDS